MDAAFANGTTHLYKPPLVAQNVFERIMKAEDLWSVDQGISTAGFRELAISPHYWNRRVMSFDLVKDDSKDAYDVQFSWSVWNLDKNKNYTICVELYQTDQWLFDHATLNLTASIGVTMNHVKITKHTHEYHGRHMLYYHKLEGQFKKMEFFSSHLCVSELRSKECHRLVCKNSKTFYVLCDVWCQRLGR